MSLLPSTITVRFLGCERAFTRDSDPTSNIYWHSLSDNDNEFANLLEEGPGWWSAHICVGEKECNFADYFAHGDSAQDAATKLEQKMAPLAKLLEPLTREPSKSLLHEMFPDLDKEDEIEIPDRPLPEGLFVSEEDE